MSILTQRTRSMESNKIEKVYNDLAKNGFTYEPIDNGINVKLNIPGMTDASLSLSILEPKQDMKDKTEGYPCGTDKNTDTRCGYHFGCRGNNHLYVANIHSSKLTDAQQHYLNAKKTMVLLHGVDLKMFRQGLDQIELSRSGIIRSSLTRIYRATENIDILLSTISDEASRAVKAKKLETIKHLSTKATDPFVKTVICLLRDAILLQTT